ncbi:hypothetical protein PAC01_15780 [Pediococcus acidilactici]|nr:hypothetical protein PAC01_15780 [Pediococcus acidilactici]
MLNWSEARVTRTFWGELRRCYKQNVVKLSCVVFLWNILSFTFGYVLEGMIETLRIDSMFFL